MASVHLKRNKQYKHFIYNTIIKSISNPIYTEVDKHLLTCSLSKYLGCMVALSSGLQGSKKFGAPSETAKPAAINREPLGAGASGYPWERQPQGHSHGGGSRRDPQLGREAVERKRFFYLSWTPYLRSNRMGGSAVASRSRSHHTEGFSSKNTPNGGASLPKHTRHLRPLTTPGALASGAEGGRMVFDLSFAGGGRRPISGFGPYGASFTAS